MLWFQWRKSMPSVCPTLCRRVSSGRVFSNPTTSTEIASTSTPRTSSLSVLNRMKKVMRNLLVLLFSFFFSTFFGNEVFIFLLFHCQKRKEERKIFFKSATLYSLLFIMYYFIWCDGDSGSVERSCCVCVADIRFYNQASYPTGIRCVCVCVWERERVCVCACVNQWMFFVCFFSVFTRSDVWISYPIALTKVWNIDEEFLSVFTRNPTGD